MDETNRGLLAQLIEKNLQLALDSESGSDEEKAAFRQAMEAIDRQTAISKIDDSYQEHAEKMEAERNKLDGIEHEKLELERKRFEFEQEKASLEVSRAEKEEAFRKEEARRTWIIRGVEIAAIYLIVPTADKLFKSKFAKNCMRWEEGNSFTSTPGKSIRDFFRF